MQESSESNRVDVITTADMCANTHRESPEFDYGTLEGMRDTQAGEELDCVFEDDTEDDWWSGKGKVVRVELGRPAIQRSPAVFMCYDCIHHGG